MIVNCLDLFTAPNKNTYIFLQVKHIYESSPEIAERIPFSYGVYMASIPALRKYILLLCGFWTWPPSPQVFCFLPINSCYFLFQFQGIWWTFGTLWLDRGGNKGVWWFRIMGQSYTLLQVWCGVKSMNQFSLSILKPYCFIWCLIWKSVSWRRKH